MASQRLRQDKLRRIRLVFEDDHLVVVDKPAGLAVHGGADTKGRDLLTVLAEAYDDPQSLHLAHRLDRGTSGLLLLTKDVQDARVVQSLWPSSTKRYAALVIGHLKGPLVIDTPLPAKDGRPQAAKSDVTPHRSASDLTLVRVAITTGRQHQIRRHLASAELPILMDDKYGNFKANKAWWASARARGVPRPKHLTLHAEAYRWPIHAVVR